MKTFSCIFVVENVVPFSLDNLVWFRSLQLKLFLHLIFTKGYVENWMFGQTLNVTTSTFNRHVVPEHRWLNFHNIFYNLLFSLLLEPAVNRMGQTPFDTSGVGVLALILYSNITRGEPDARFCHAVT